MLNHQRVCGYLFGLVYALKLYVTCLVGSVQRIHLHLRLRGYGDVYPLVNTQKTIENNHILWVNQL